MLNALLKRVMPQSSPAGAKQRPEPAASPREKVKPLTKAERMRMANQPPSFTSLLPWSCFDPADRIFDHVDGRTKGVMLEILPVATEAQPVEIMKQLQKKVQAALQSLDEVKSPWIVQFFVNDDRNLAPQKALLREYIQKAYPKDKERSTSIYESVYTQDFLNEMERHFDLVSRPEGLFKDEQVSGEIWRGQVRRVRCFAYRAFLEGESQPKREQLENAAAKMTASLVEAGIKVRRCDGKDFYDWMLPFFNRNPSWVPTPEDLVGSLPYPQQRAGEAPLHLDMAELLTLSQPRSDPDGGYWEFDGVRIKAMVLQNLTEQPGIGHITAELQHGDRKFARFDRMPPNTMLSMTIVIQPQYEVKGHVENIQKKSRARTPDAQATHAESEMVLKRMTAGDNLVPMVMTLYVSGRTDKELADATTVVNTQLTPSGLRFIDPRFDLSPLDAFIRGLPMAFDPSFDQKQMRRARYVFCSQVASLLPLYGRSRGTGHPGFMFWNRGGEPLYVDPLNHRDRKKNAHMLMMGPTGAGKSATLNYLCMLVMAIYRARLVIVDAGKSFDLLQDHFEAFGLSTHRVEMTSQADVSLPPFVHALRLLDDPDIMESFTAAEAGVIDENTAPTSLTVDPTLISVEEAAERVVVMANESDALKPSAIAEDEKEEDGSPSERRDLLGEMMISAIMMITGGEEKEIDRMTRADRYLVSRAIILAAIGAKKAGKKHPLTVDVAVQLMNMTSDASLSVGRQARAEEMGQAMMEFTKALRGKLFNRQGSDWPEVDVTLIELGTLTADGYGDAMALAYTSIIDSVQSRGEQYQYEGRPLVFLTDEAHLVSTNKLLGPKLAKATKMWRKLNIWLWLATQNMKDFPDSMSRVLSMCEWWVLLTMAKDEIEEVSRFRALTPEQRSMLESAVKERPKYTEGVILSSIGQMLFRNVPPALPIALAMTESHEKADRARLMKQHGITEMDAARMIARQLEEARS